MTDFKEGDRVTVITAPPPSPEATELAVTICRNNTEGIALALDRFAAAARGAALDEAAELVIDACGRDNDSELAERAADAFNAGPMRQETAIRLERHGAVIAVAIRALAQPKSGETE